MKQEHPESFGRASARLVTFFRFKGLDPRDQNGIGLFLGTAELGKFRLQVGRGTVHIGFTALTQLFQKVKIFLITLLFDVGVYAFTSRTFGTFVGCNKTFWT